jgi:hypothetical protein
MIRIACAIVMSGAPPEAREHHTVGQQRDGLSIRRHMEWGYVAHRELWQRT